MANEPVPEAPPADRRAPLLDQVAREFASCSARTLAADCIRLARPGGVSFTARELVSRSFMNVTRETEFRCALPGCDAGAGQISLVHRGALRRTGIGGRVERGDSTTAALLARLLADQRLCQALLPLDFRTFRLHWGDTGWAAVTVLMGGAWVAMSFPPLQRYIAMGEPQAETLCAAFARLLELCS